MIGPGAHETFAKSESTGIYVLGYKHRLHSFVYVSTPLFLPSTIQSWVSYSTLRRWFLYSSIFSEGEISIGDDDTTIVQLTRWLSIFSLGPSFMLSTFGVELSLSHSSAPSPHFSSGLSSYLSYQTGSQALSAQLSRYDQGHKWPFHKPKVLFIKLYLESMMELTIPFYRLSFNHTEPTHDINIC